MIDWSPPSIDLVCIVNLRRVVYGSAIDHVVYAACKALNTQNRRNWARWCDALHVRDKKNGNHWDSNHLSWVFISSKNECSHLPRIFSYGLNVIYSQTIRNAWKYASISIASVSSGPSTAANTKHTDSKSFESFNHIFERKRYVFTLFSSLFCLRIRKDSQIKTTNSLRKIEID